jgi:site-specific DNA-methyltransferase (adenine-specific)
MVGYNWQKGGKTMKNDSIWQLGVHRLACGSATDPELVKRLVGKDKIDLILVDPPFGISMVQSKQWLVKDNRHKVILNDDITDDATFEAFTKAWLEVIKPYLASKNSVYIFNSDKMMIPTIQALRATGAKFAQLLIWAKTQAVIGRLDYLPQHELIIYGWYGTHKFHKSKDKSILVYPKPNKSKLHPTMKPVGLLRRLILNSSRIGDVVYDSFVGSGSCLLACEQTKRRCLAVELDPDYCLTVINRWERLTGLKATKLEGKL